MIDMDWHEAACLFPMMGERELQELADDIKAHGQHEPVLLLGGAILDGRNRYRACQIAGVEPKFDYADGRVIGDPFRYVASLNLHRRHLTESQRAMVGAKMKEHFAVLAKERQREGGKIGGESDAKGSANLHEASRASADAAALVNVSTRSVDSASRVIERGAPELVAAVERGDVAVSAAAEVSRLPIETQRAAVADGTVSKLAKDQREARKAKPVEDESAYDPGEDDGEVELFDASRLAAEPTQPVAPSPAFTFDERRMQEFREVSGYVSKILAHIDAMQSCPQLASIEDPSTRKMLENAQIKAVALYLSRLPEESQQRPTFRVIEGGNK